MTNTIRVLTPQEIAEADQLGEQVHRCRDALDKVRFQIETAVLAGVAQDSALWDQLCNDLAAKAGAHNAATTAERDWWRSKDFNV